MQTHSLLLDTKDDDMDALLEGSIPTEGTCIVGIQFNKYKMTSGDEKKALKLMDKPFTDGDAARPLFLSGEVDANTAKKIVNGFGDRLLVATIIQTGKGFVFKRAKSKVAFRFFMGWIAQLRGM